MKLLILQIRYFSDALGSETLNSLPLFIYCSHLYKQTMIQYSHSLLLLPLFNKVLSNRTSDCPLYSSNTTTKLSLTMNI